MIPLTIPNAIIFISGSCYDGDPRSYLIALYKNYDLLDNTVDASRNAIYSARKGGSVYPIGEHPSLPPDLSEIFISDILVHRHLEMKGLMYFPIKRA